MKPSQSVVSPLNFNEDFEVYTKALYALKQKYPDGYIVLHECASNVIRTYDAVQEIFQAHPIQ